MRKTSLAVAALATATLLAAAGCGKSGSSGTSTPNAGATSAGCGPLAGDTLVVLDDDKHLQTVDNLIPAVYGKASNPALIGALDKVSASLDTQKLIQANKAMDIDRKTPKAEAAEFAAQAGITSGLQKGSGTVKIGAANFSENEFMAELYAIALKAAGFTASTQTVGNRELYLPALERGELQVVPEYAGTLTEFLNQQINGSNAAPKASSDLNKTVAALKDLGGKKGLAFGQASPAADQNAFAVTKALADKYSLKTLSDFASKCSGQASILGGPPECPTRPFCQVGLQNTYGIKFGQFKSLDAGGPQTKNALKTGTITMGLVFSSDGALAAG